ncbi:MAG: hypothetical protein KDD00_02580 [Ignavibacteriae bacterium]|nr:hypothetical protein [Ignavibacteriota bacterium]
MKKHFCYKLSLNPRLYRNEDWTENDIETVSIHFNYLKDLLAKKILFLAGRTVHEPMSDKDFGIAILEVDTIEEARTIMENDPAIKGGIMTGELFEFSLALFRD